MPGYYSEKNTPICSPCKAGYQCSDPAGMSDNHLKILSHGVLNVFFMRVVMVIIPSD